MAYKNKSLEDVNLFDPYEATDAKDTQNNSRLHSIENYISEKYDKVTLEDLKKDILGYVQNHLNMNDNNTSNDNNFVINKYKDEINNLKGEIYFLRDQLKEKNYWISQFLIPKYPEVNIKNFEKRDDNDLKHSVSKIINELLLNDSLKKNNEYNHSSDENSIEKHFEELNISSVSPKCNSIPEKSHNNNIFRENSLKNNKSDGENDHGIDAINWNIYNESILDNDDESVDRL